MLISLLLGLACTSTSPADSADTGALGVGPIRSCHVVIDVAKAGGAATAQIAGSFSQWEPVEAEVADDRVRLDVGELSPGTYPYKVLWDGAWESVPDAEPQMFADGVLNRALVVGDCERPSLTPLGLSVDDDTITATFQFTRAADGAALDPTSLTATAGESAAEVGHDAQSGVITVVATGLPPGKHTVRVNAVDRSGRPPEAGPGWLPAWVEEQPFAWSDGAIYFTFTDRFRDGGPSDADVPLGAAYPGVSYMGGDLTGVRDALEEGWFEAMGVRTLWLSPVTDNPDHTEPGLGNLPATGYHGYWPIKARAIEPRWGARGETGEEALHALITAAHARGIRVMFDLVLNHVHDDHEWIDTHPEWFTAAPCPCQDGGPCDWNGNPTGCWFTGYLPDLDHREQAIVEETVRDIDHWLHAYDVDGFRVDAAKHMEHVVMRTIAHHLDDTVHASGAPTVLLLGETFTGSGAQDQIMAYVADHELDGQFDFPTYWQIRHAFRDNGSLLPLADELRLSDAKYGEAVHNMSVFLGNHDVPRFVTDLRGLDDCTEPFGACADPLAEQLDDAERLADRLMAAWTVVMTQPGPPLIYYGDELGLAGGPDPDNRRLMPWGTPTPPQGAVLERVQRLGAARADSKALRRGSRRILYATDDVLVFARDAGAGEVAIVAVTRSHDGPITIPVEANLGLEGVSLTDVLGGGSLSVNQQSATVTMAAWSSAVWVRQ